MPATTEALRIIILFIIPGFITQTVIGSSISRRTRDVSQITIEAIVFSCIIYGLGGLVFFIEPLPSLAFFNQKLSTGEIIKAGIVWFGFFFALPIVLGFLFSSLAHRRWLGIHNFLGLPSISPQPRAWDFYFSQGKQAWVIITLKDNIRIGGYMGVDSSVASYPAGEDIYLEATYTVSDDGKLSEKPVPNTQGIWVQGSEIKFIEFLQPPVSEVINVPGQQAQQPPNKQRTAN